MEENPVIIDESDKENEETVIQKSKIPSSKDSKFGKQMLYLAL